MLRESNYDTKGTTDPLKEVEYSNFMLDYTDEDDLVKRACHINEDSFHTNGYLMVTTVK
jgi:hypothetical protein